jgi:predicted nucleic acid-binding protein
VAPIVLDADVLIGFLDDTDAQHARALHSLQPYLAAGHQVLVATSVYSEVLVQPFRAGRAEVVDEFLAASGARLVPVDRAIARRAAQLRAEHRGLRLPDALALATARELEAPLLTLDEGLQRIAAHE